MTVMGNRTAWIEHKGATLHVADSEVPTPKEGEILVKVMVIALSPIESMIQRFETHPISYPNVLGQSYSGIVESVGNGVTKVVPGDRVAVMRPPSKVSDDLRLGSFQKFAIAYSDCTSKLLASTSLESGAATILNLATVVAALTVYMNLDRPLLETQPSLKEETILIYGGSSSCGWLATSFVKQAGYKVVTTSSPKNHDFVKALQPNQIIDHTQNPEDILRDLHAHGPYKAILDTVGTPPVNGVLARYLSSLGGSHHYHSLVPLFPGEGPTPTNIQRTFASYSSAFHERENAEIRDWFLDECLPRGLDSGIIKPTRVREVPGGLEGIQTGLNMMAQREVSCEKLILHPWA